MSFFTKIAPAVFTTASVRSPEDFLHSIWSVLSRNHKDQVENNWQYSSVLSLKPQGIETNIA
jgi:hypothetical protein